VVSNPAVPRRIRRLLNVESGLNDGLATPIVAVLLVVVAEEQSGSSHWLLDAAKALAVAVAVAAVVGVLVGALLRRAAAAGWTTRLSEQLAMLSMALAAYAGAVWLGGNGFVAAFVAGLLAGPTARALPEAVELTEIGGVLMSWVVWTAFGVLFVGPLVTATWSWSALAYAALSLTVIRALPVALALLGQGLKARTVAFIGWFGPRGLASVVFLIITIEDVHLPATNPLVQAASWTIILSVVLHGLSAGPLARAYGRFVAALPDSAPEHGKRDAGDPRLRLTRLGR
jgi:NhaP-type Na+/H+ or K+/H+ antiporter